MGVRGDIVMDVNEFSELNESSRSLSFRQAYLWTDWNIFCNNLTCWRWVCLVSARRAHGCPVCAKAKQKEKKNDI